MPGNPMAQQELEEKIGGAPAVLFVQSGCPHCDRVGALLRASGAAWSQHEAPPGSALRSALNTRSNATTAPQLFIGGELVGGADATRELVASGSLGALLLKARALGSSGHLADADGAAQAAIAAWPAQRTDWSTRPFCDAFLHGGNVPDAHGGGATLVAISVGVALLVYLLAAAFTPLGSAWRWCILVPLLGGGGSGIQGVTNT